MHDSYSSPDSDLPPVESASESTPVHPRRLDVQAMEFPSQGPGNHGGFSVANRLSWLLALMAFMVTFSFFVPFVVEQVQYSLTRGRQRAQYELAAEGLKDQPLQGLSLAFQMVSQKVGPSVVHINNIASVNRSTAARLGFKQLPSYPSGQGSGVIIDAEGHILTNGHVVADSDSIEVKLSDGRTVEAHLVGTDSLTDLAVLKVDAQGLIPVEWGDSDSITEGALVWALGSPFGLERSTTFGILSAKHRAGKAGTPYQDFLQTDAAVNPGNSGGPLVDSQGRLIGINTAIVGESYQGISFAVPSNVARGIFERIKTQGRVTRGWLGVEPTAVAGLTPGAMVLRVVEGTSPASLAGIRPGDVIVSWNDQPIETPNALFTAVADTPIGSVVNVAILRGQQEMSVPVRVAERPALVN